MRMDLDFDPSMKALLSSPDDIFLLLFRVSNAGTQIPPPQLYSGSSIYPTFTLSIPVPLLCYISLVKRSWALQGCNPTRNSQVDRGR
jgi:hypothetical protein